ncbi:39S ribosomal protein L32, mitochondrial [Condylostylus longicornis]|uniref:39S ribosomal protein L32, mitochondrial n=1 Tax=Condylostylus longicornis TaxID=2530218 RepID=UPI00244E0C0D|nr:39S ribosomal protein L32, mitochondrial [Condylostylus longicornis]
MDKILKSAIECVRKLHSVFNMLKRGPEPVYALSCLELPYVPSNQRFTIKDLIGDGFLLAVPRNRRTIERRWQRKFGSPEYVWKLFKPKTNIRSCVQCGHDHLIGVLCPNCYEKVRKETELMQQKIEEALGNEKVDRDVIVLYEGEKINKMPEFLENKRIIEMKKPRPMWFSKNLLQKSTQKTATTKEVKPSDLG